MRLKMVFLWVMIAALSISAAMGVMVIVFEDAFGQQEELLVTSLLVGAFSMICLACAFVLEHRCIWPVMWVGLISSLIALGIWLALVWGDALWGFMRYEHEELIAQTGGTFTVICLWAAHTGLLTILSMRRSRDRIVRGVTYAVSGSLAAMLLFIIWIDRLGEFEGRTIAVLSILGACGTVVTPVLALIEHYTNRQRPGAMGERVSIALTCPRCGESQSLKAGPSKCRSCGLRITIDVEEPHCTCGYLLYRLQGDRCPECGAQIPERDRWSAHTADHGAPPEPPPVADAE